MAEDRKKLDAGAVGGLTGLAIVVVGFVGLVAWQSGRPLLFALAMALIGAAAFVFTWAVAARRRRYFSAVEWLVLSLLFTVCYLLLLADPSPELRRFYDEDPSRQGNVLFMSGLLAAIGLVSFWMLRRQKEDPPK